MSGLQRQASELGFKTPEEVSIARHRDPAAFEKYRILTEQAKGLETEVAAKEEKGRELQGLKAKAEEYKRLLVGPSDEELKTEYEKAVTEGNKDKELALGKEIQLRDKVRRADEAFRKHLEGGVQGLFDTKAQRDPVFQTLRDKWKTELESKETRQKDIKELLTMFAKSLNKPGGMSISQAMQLMKERGVLEAIQNKVGNVEDWLKDFGTGKTSTRNISPSDVMHSGGKVDETGFKYLQKGELVLPANLADGASVPEVARLIQPQIGSSLSGKTEVDSTGFESAIGEFKNVVTKLEDLIKNTKLDVDTSKQIEVNTTGVSIPVNVAGVSVPIEVGSAVVPVDVGDARVGVDIGTAMVPVDVAGAMVGVDIAGVTIPVDIAGLTIPVDVGDVKVPVDTTGASVELNAGDIADRIAASIKGAVGTGGTVGAERVDALAETIKAMDDRLLSVKSGVTEMISANSVEIQELKAELSEKVRIIESSVRREVDGLRNQSADLRSSVSDISHRYDSKFSNIEYNINNIKSLSMSKI